MEDGQPVFIIVGKVWVDKGGPATPVHIMLRGADDDSAIREALNALSEKGYDEAEFDQIGTLTDAPFEEPHASAYQGAMEGEVAIVSFDPDTLGEDGHGFVDDEEETKRDGHFIDDDDPNYDPFAALKDWKPADK